MGDFTSRITHLFKADTSQAEAAVKRYRGVQREQAKAMLDDLNAQNEKLEAQIATWGKVALGVTAAVVVFKGLQGAAKAALEDIRLETAAAGINVDKLTAATRGLVEEDKLLEFAGRTQAGMWKLNEAEMQKVLRGADAIAKKTGQELTPVIDALTESIAKGNTRALKEFGIEAKDKQGVLEDLDAIWQSLGGNTARAGDELRASGVKVANAMDNVKGSIGRLVVALGPAIEKLAQFIEYAAGAIEMVANPKGWLNDMKDAIAGPAARTSYEHGQTMGGGVIDIFAAQRAQRMAAGLARGEKALEDSVRIAEETAARLRARGRGRGGRDYAGDPIGFGETMYGAFRGAGGELGGAIGRTYADAQRQVGFSPIGDRIAGDMDVIKVNSMNAQLEEAKRTLDEIGAAIEANVHGKEKILETLFGTPAEINLQAEALGQVGAMFNVVTGAAGAAFDAWITGGKSMGAAFKEAIAEGLRGVAVQASVEAMKHTAFGFGALAFGPIMGVTAAQHFKAAAMFGGVAAAAGVGAHFLGKATGQWSRGNGGAGGVAAAGTGRGGGGGPVGDQQSQTVIMLGSDFGMLTSLQQKQLLHQAIQLGKSRGGSTTRVRRG